MLVMGLVFAIGQVSGAHFNPAVSVAFSLRFAFHWWRLLYYIPAQFVGALVIFVTQTTRHNTTHDTRHTTHDTTRHNTTQHDTRHTTHDTRHATYIATGAMLGSLVVMGFLGTEGDVGASLPQGMTIQAALGLEIAFSSIFLFVVLNVAERAKVVGPNGALATGLALIALATVGGYLEHSLSCVSCVSCACVSCGDESDTGTDPRCVAGTRVQAIGRHVDESLPIAGAGAAVGRQGAGRGVGLHRGSARGRSHRRAAHLPAGLARAPAGLPQSHR